MIITDMKEVSVITFSNGVDSYGQKRKTQSSIKTVKMAIYPYSNMEVEDIRFREVTHIGLTKDTTITNANEIEEGSNKYLVTHTIPSNRYTQIFLKEKK